MAKTRHAVADAIGRGLLPMVAALQIEIANLFMIGVTPGDNGMIGRSNQLTQQRLRQLADAAQIRVLEVRGFRPGVGAIGGVEELDDQVKAIGQKFEAAFDNVIRGSSVARESVYLTRERRR